MCALHPISIQGAQPRGGLFGVAQAIGDNAPYG